MSQVEAILPKSRYRFKHTQRVNKTYQKILGINSAGQTQDISKKQKNGIKDDLVSHQIN